VSEEQPEWRRKAERFLASARLLVEAGDFDSAAGRAYYAMFHAAEALLKTRGLEFKTHGALISAYGQEFAKSGELPVHLHRSLSCVLKAEEFLRAAAGWLERSGG